MPGDRPVQYLAIGGLPRSGTSSCERWLHGYRGIFVADEFQGFNDAAYLAGLAFKGDYIHSEIELWTDENGRTWRGTTRDRLDRGRTIAEIVNLLLHTRPSKFAGKDPADCLVFGFKLPLLEEHFADVWPSFGKQPFPFLYCARDPAAILQSLWTMPWVAPTDEDSFVEATRLHIRQSLDGLDRVVATGAPTAIWRTPCSEYDANDAIAQLGLSRLAGARDEQPGAIDEWPKQRRRSRPALSDGAMRTFNVSPEVQRYRERLAV